jgi:hypothetical protein
MDLSDFRPKPALVTKETVITKPRFPVFDAHNHLMPGFGGGWDQRPVGELLDVLDAADVTHLLDLDGMWGEDVLDAHLKHFKEAAPERFIIFGGVNWGMWPEKGDRFGEWAAERLRAQVQRGAQGVKAWKNLGLEVKDQNGVLVRVSDVRLDPLWQMAGELNVPVTLHIADPVAFFSPVDNTNERWEELADNPDWQFPSPPCDGAPSWHNLHRGALWLLRRKSGLDCRNDGALPQLQCGHFGAYWRTGAATLRSAALLQ